MSGSVPELRSAAARHRERVARWVRVALVVIASFHLISAIGGAWGLMSGGIVAMGLPLSLLDGSIFDSYFWPGVILGVVIGGTQLIALVAQYARLSLTWGLHAVAGFGLMIWIFVETGIIRGLSPLQFIYFGTGLLQCVLVLLALGVWPRPFWGRGDDPHESDNSNAI